MNFTDRGYAELASAFKRVIHISEHERPWGLQPVDEAFLSEQERAADLFHRFGLLPLQIDVRQATLSVPVNFAKAA